MSPRWLGVLGLVSVLLLASCAGAPKQTPLDAELAGLGVDARMGLWIEVENPEGSVRVEGDPACVIASAQVWLRSVDGREFGEAGWARVSSRIENGRTRVTVDATGAPVDGSSKSKRPRGAVTDVVVRVPRLMGVRIKNAGGPVRVVGANGGLWVENNAVRDGVPGRMRVRSGEIEVSRCGAITEDVTILSGDGDVSVELGAGSKGRIEAQSESGVVRVASRPAVSGATARPELWRGQVGNGENLVHVRTARGTVVLELN